MTARTQKQKCTMKLRSRQNTWWKFTSIKIDSLFLKTRTSRHFFQQLKIIQCLFYELFKVEKKPQIWSNINKDKLIREYKCRYRTRSVFGITFMKYIHNQKIRNRNNVKVVESMTTNSNHISRTALGGESYFW